MEGLIAFFTFLDLKLMAAVVLEERLFFIELSDSDVVGDEANSFSEFLVCFLLNSSLATACAC